MTTKCQHDSSSSLPLITFSPLRKVTKLSRIFIFNTLILPVKQQPVNKINPYPVLTLYHITTCTIIVHFLSFTLLIMLIKTSSTPIIIDRRAQIPPKPTRIDTGTSPKVKSCFFEKVMTCKLCELSMSIILDWLWSFSMLFLVIIVIML